MFILSVILNNIFDYLDTKYNIIVRHYNNEVVISTYLTHTNKFEIIWNLGSLDSMNSLMNEFFLIMSKYIKA